ncbi:MAG: hypothetical protein ABJB66_15150 [Gemmatimonadaceae bacterium]
MRLLHLNSRTKPYAARATILLAVLAMLSGCKDNKTPSEPQSVTLTAGTPSLTISSAAPGTVPLILTRVGGYTGSVAITFEGLPTGVTATADPAPITGSGTTSTTTFTAGATAVAGTSTVTIRGTGSGLTAVTTTVQVTVAPAAIGLTIGATTASAPQGGTATIGVTITRQNGFAGAVNLAAEGLPTGVTATFAPSSIAAGSTTSTLTLNVDGGATAATSPITIRATGTGITDQVGSVQLTITQSGTPDYTITAAPAALTVLAGANGTSTINLARSGGFTGNIALTAAIAGTPVGVTATLAPNPATASSSTLTLATTAATPAGTYNVTITGNTAVTTNHSVVVSLVVTPLPGVTFTFAPTTLSIPQSGTATNAITIARVGGLTGDVVLTAENLPTGVTAAFAPATVLAANATSTLTLTATGAATMGTSNVSIRATQGATSSTGTLALTVTGPAGFTTAVTGSPVSIAQAASGTITANITRTNGFAGTVNLAVTGLPAGITTTFTPSAAITGTTATINLDVAGTVAIGSYTGTLTSTSTGLPNATTTFTVNVTGGVGGSSIVWQFCDPARIPLFFAVRDGNTGVWTSLTPASNSYTFALSQATGGVAYVLPAGGGFATTVYLAAKSDLATRAAAECTSNPGGGKTVTGSVTGLGTFEGATVALGSGVQGGISGFVPNYTLNNVLPGPRELVAVRATTNIGTGTSTVDKLVIRPAIDQAANTSIAAINFAAAEAFNPITGTVTLANLGADAATATTEFTPATGGLVSLGSTAGTGAIRTLLGVPVGQQAAGDLHQVSVRAAGINQLARGALAYFHDLTTPHTITLGASLPEPTVSGSVSSNIFRPRLQGTIPADYAVVSMAKFVQSNRSVTITATRAYFPTDQYDLEVPDLGALNGFNATWGLLQNTNTSFTATFLSALPGTQVDGTVILFGLKDGSTTSSQALRQAIRK